MSKSEKAIQTLNRHLIELENVTNVFQGNNWKASLRDSLNLYIGPESSISTRLDKLYFSRRESVMSEDGVFDVNVYEDSNKENFRHLIANAINHIESNGLYKIKSRNNFLGGFSNTEIISGLVVGVGIIITVSIYLGRFEKEREIIELQKTIDKKDQNIKELEEGQNAELKTLKIENKNLWDTYHKLYDENENLKKKKK
jgi:hypothetical protein